MEEMKLSLKRKEFKVVLESEGVETPYLLREMNGKERDSHLTSIADRMKYDAKGNVKGLKSFDGLHAALLTRTLFTEDGKPVSVDVIQDFPASVVSKLFDKSQEINALDDDSAKEAKND